MFKDVSQLYVEKQNPFTCNISKNKRVSIFKNHYIANWIRSKGKQEQLEFYFHRNGPAVNGFRYFNIAFSVAASIGLVTI